MSNVIEIGTTNGLEERRRNVLIGVMTVAMMDEWTESNIFGFDGIREQLRPVIDATLAQIQEEGVDILQIENDINELRERMIDFMKENVIGDE